MSLYLHDSHRLFRFVLRGSLEGPWVRELEGAWITARSILRAKDVIVDLSGLTEADEEGIGLLSRMAESGVRLIAASPPESPGLARLLGTPAAQALPRQRPIRSLWSSLLCWLVGCGHPARRARSNEAPN